MNHTIEMMVFAFLKLFVPIFPWRDFFSYLNQPKKNTQKSVRHPKIRLEVRQVPIELQDLVVADGTRIAEVVDSGLRISTRDSTVEKHVNTMRPWKMEGSCHRHQKKSMGIMEFKWGVLLYYGYWGLFILHTDIPVQKPVGETSFTGMPGPIFAVPSQWHKATTPAAPSCC